MAKEAILALTITRPLETDEGVDAARFLQSSCWGKDLVLRTLAPDENGKMNVSVALVGTDETINAKLIEEGLARVKSSSEVLNAKMLDPEVIPELHQSLKEAEQVARKARVGMWRYGDVGDEDPDEI